MKIEGVVIRISETQTVQLSLEDAQKLYEELQTLFGKNYITVNPPITPIDRPIYPNSPIVAYTLAKTNGSTE